MFCEKAKTYNFISPKDYVHIQDSDLRAALVDRYGLRILEHAGSTVNKTLFRDVFGDEWFTVPYQTLFKLAKSTVYKGQPERKYFAAEKVNGRGKRFYNNSARLQEAEMGNVYVRFTKKYFKTREITKLYESRIMLGVDARYPSYEGIDAYAKSLSNVIVGCKKYYKEGLARIKTMDMEEIRKLRDRVYWNGRRPEDKKRMVNILGKDNYEFVEREYWRAMVEGTKERLWYCGDDKWTPVVLRAYSKVYSACSEAMWCYTGFDVISRRIVRHLATMKRISEARRMLDEMGLDIDGRNTLRYPSRISGKLFRAIKNVYNIKGDDEVKRNTLMQLSKVINVENYSNAVYAPLIVTKEA